MRETNILQWLSFVAVAAFVWLLFRFGKAGSDQIARPVNEQGILPNTCRPLTCTAPFVLENNAICLASDYLTCNPGYSPATSKAQLRMPINYAHLPIPVAQCQQTTVPHVVKQCCTPPSYAPVQAPSCCGLTQVTCEENNCSAMPI